MNPLQKAVLRNIFRESQGDLNTGVSKSQYARSLEHHGDGNLALVMYGLHETGYVRFSGASYLGLVYLTDQGRQKIQELAQA